MNYIRLKANLSEACLQDRFRYEPEIIELYLCDEDVVDERLLIQRIRELKQRGIKVFLHHPPKHKGVFPDIMSEDEEWRTYYRLTCEKLARICQEEDVRCVVHAHYEGTVSSYQVTLERTALMRERIAEILVFAGDRFLWEDTTHGLFSYANPYLLDTIIVPLQLPLNVDISHSFIALKGSNEKLKEVLANTANYASYYHLVDSRGVVHDSLPLGEGGIDWAMVKPFVEQKDFIFEIMLAGDQTDCTPMIRSAAFFKAISRN